MKDPHVLAVVVVITTPSGNVRQCECMIITGGCILKLLSEGSLRRLHQPTEHLEDRVAAMVITGERAPARDAVIDLCADLYAARPVGSGWSMHR